MKETAVSSLSLPHIQVKLKAFGRVIAVQQKRKKENNQFFFTKIPP